MGNRISTENMLENFDLGNKNLGGAKYLYIFISQTHLSVFLFYFKNEMLKKFDQ